MSKEKKKKGKPKSPSGFYSVFCKSMQEKYGGRVWSQKYHQIQACLKDLCSKLREFFLYKVFRLIAENKSIILWKE